MKYLLILLFCLFVTSCNKKSNSHDHHGHDHSDHDHSHEHHVDSHEPPNGGVLTEVGDHSASLEWVIEEGKLLVYIFDGCAEKPIRVSQKELKVNLKAGEDKELVLLPVTNELTGEKPGDSNTFQVEISNISKENISGISVHSVNIQGIDYKNVNLKVE